MLFQLLRQVVSTNADAFTFLYLLAVVLIGIALPFMIGRFVANRIRMADYGWRIGLILMTVVLACEIIGRTWDPAAGGFRIPLGVDLQGGVILIYEVEEGVTVVTDEQGQESRQASQEGDTSFSMGALIEALSRRINPTGTKEIVIRPYGDRQVEIIIPEVDQREVDQIKKTISTAGVLQFRIVANQRRHQVLIDLATVMAKDPVAKRGRIVRDENRQPVALWARVGREQRTLRGVRPFRLDMTGFTLRNATTGDLVDIPPDAVTGRDDDQRRVQLAQYCEKEGIPELDVLMATDDGYDVNGSHLGTVSRGYDEVLNPAIHFNLKGRGVALFSDLTGDFSPDGQFRHQLGIVLDNELLSAPNIQERITGQGRITGNFTQEEVDFLVNILQAGSLPVVLNKSPIAEDLINPLLGKETVERSQMAMVISLLLVFAVVCAYYRFSGIIASLAMLANLLYILALMVLINAALTLPGIAGLVLTVGMSIDANVLIYERMREEMAKGSTLRMAIRNGFSRATVTIIDSNLTTIITAIVLYLIGTDQIRGFAVTLILGILASMFTAIFCARVAFDVAERTKTLSRLRMMNLFPSPNYDFLRLQRICAMGSILLIVIGLVSTVARGRGLFDIDFNGGTSVHLLLSEPTETRIVRDILERKFKEIDEQYTLTGMSRATGRTANQIYKVDSSLPEVEQLERTIREAFQQAGGTVRLATYSLERGPVRRLTETSPASNTSDASDRADESETAAPAGSEGSHLQGAEANLLAFAEEVAALLDSVGESAAAEASASPESSSTVAAGSEPPVASDAAQIPQSVPPVDQSTATSESKPAGDAPSSGSEALLEVPLTFAYPINEETLRGEIEDAASAANLAEPYFQLVNPQWEGGSNAFNDWTLRIAADEQQTDALLNQLSQQFSQAPVWPSSSKIGSQVADRMQNRAIAALVFSWFGIVIYIWIRFQHLTFGLAAVVALVHDVLITLGAISVSAWLANYLGFLLIEEFKINLTVVAALLTVIGYSVNDTIVVFDRIREVRGKSPRLTYDMVNLSLNQTLGRTILTGSTTIIVLVVLYGWGGEGIHAFCFALLIGCIVGTYSSIYVATPVVLWMSGVKKAAPKQPAAVTHA